MGKRRRGIGPTDSAFSKLVHDSTFLKLLTEHGETALPLATRITGVKSNS